MARSLYEKLWDDHVVEALPDGRALLYVDRHLLHEVTSPHAFAALRRDGIKVWRADANLAVADHAVPTRQRGGVIADQQAREQIALLEANCSHYGIPYLALDGEDQGIVHVIGPEQGFTLPGITLVCGDSHSATHGAFGALAFGIGASECTTVLATQTVWQNRAMTMRVTFSGELAKGVYAKDLILALIGQIGSGGGAGYAIEFSGEAVRAMSMEARMTLCNMAIEAGSRVGLVAPDDKTFAYLEGRTRAPQGALWAQALTQWRQLKSDGDAVFDRELNFDAAQVAPQVTFGTSPDQVVSVDGAVPRLADCKSEEARTKLTKALEYMGLREGEPIRDIRLSHVFIGSCTNGRIEDLRAAAAHVAGRRVASGVTAIVVPGSQAVRRQAEAEGLDKIFENAGLSWRNAGCSLCIGMNDDRLGAGARCASTSNRNFEGRQGVGARTHLVSPATAAAAAIAGRFVDIRENS